MEESDPSESDSWLSTRGKPDRSPDQCIPERSIDAVCPVRGRRGEAVPDSVPGAFPNDNYIRPVSGAGSIVTYWPEEEGYLAWSCAILAAHRAEGLGSMRGRVAKGRGREKPC